MRRLLAVCCAVTLASGTAAAQPSIGGYAEPSVLGGVKTLHGTRYGERVDTTGAVVGLRLTLGLHLDDARGRVWRVGGSLALLVGSADSVLLGIEGNVDWPVSTDWRLGPRLELARGDDSDGGEGLRVSAGASARNRDVTFGLDVFGGRAYSRGTGDVVAFDGWTAGAVMRVGLRGRPGVYAEIVVVVASLLAFAALGGPFGGTH